MENKTSFGKYILQKRKEAGLTQKVFADKLFVTESAVSKWERGKSYPDISLLHDICELLNISERELLTASEDTMTRQNEKLASRYIKITKRVKHVQIAIYALTLITCFITDWATSGGEGLSWFFIVAAGVLLAASITLLPMYVEKNRGLITLAAIAASLLLLLLVCNIFSGGDWFILVAVSVIFGGTVLFLPYVLRSLPLPQPYGNHKALMWLAASSVLLLLLLLVCDLYTNGGWFLSTALPLALFCLLAPWGMLLIIRYTPLNAWFKAAACCVLAAVFQFFANGVFDMIIENKPAVFSYAFNFADWSSNTLINANISAIIIFAFVGQAVVYAVLGIIRHRKRTDSE